MWQLQKTRKRVKKSGIIYFAVNPRIPDMVKIGMTIESAESRLKTANRKHEFMCGRWAITQKVKTNDVKRTEDLSHKIFADFHDKESVSTEMFFIPKDMTVKQMADDVREKDQVMREQREKQNKAMEAVDKAKEALEKLKQETHELITLKPTIEEQEDK
ncbi:MAG: GIY-YIG nuclease family protein [Candidatus Thioglobus sp.]|nr:GIY-YIG nuclease family protein [Candidatus Thioglobus sp.]